MLPIPIASIDWKTLCNSAIWRIAPFVPDAKNPDAEKGFRDALISETVVALAKAESRNVNIAFVCNDFVLRTATAERLKADARFACYESLLDFSSYIKLTREKLTNEFIKKIVKRAAEKFYSEEDPNCLLLKEDLIAKLEINRSHCEMPDFAPPITYVSSVPPIRITGSSPLSYLAPIQNSLFSQSVFPTWTPDTRSRWVIGPQEFQNVTGDRTYHWKTTLTYVRKYSSTNSVGDAGSGSLEFTFGDKILLVKFNVFWKANVKDDARFHNVALESTDFDGKEFRPPTDAERQRFELNVAKT